MKIKYGIYFPAVYSFLNNGDGLNGETVNDGGVIYITAYNDNDTYLVGETSLHETVLGIIDSLSNGSGMISGQEAKSAEIIRDALFKAASDLGARIKPKAIASI